MALQDHTRETTVDSLCNVGIREASQLTSVGGGEDKIVRMSQKVSHLDFDHHQIDGTPYYFNINHGKSARLVSQKGGKSARLVSQKRVEWTLHK